MSRDALFSRSLNSPTRLPVTKIFLDRSKVWKSESVGDRTIKIFFTTLFPVKWKRKVLFVRQAFGLSQDSFWPLHGDGHGNFGQDFAYCGLMCVWFFWRQQQTIVLSNVYCLANRALLSPETEAFMQWNTSKELNGKLGKAQVLSPPVAGHTVSLGKP